MLSPALTAVLLAQPWWFRGSALDLDFQNNRAAINGQPAGLATDQCSITRTTAGYALNPSGVLVPFTSGQFRRTGSGLLVEEARTNSALWSRDMTNAAWVKVNMTAALTATGIDGTANSATTLTATAGNATALQAIVSISQADTYSVWIKRVSGSGVVNISLNGAAWTPVTLTTTWTQFQITSTLLNPNLGIQIVTSGDVIAADFNQAELGQSFATSPILTTTVAVTRNADVVQVIGAGATIIPLSASAFFQTFGQEGLGASPRFLDMTTTALSATSGPNANANDGTNNASALLGSGTYAGTAKIAYGLDNVSMTVIANGGTKGIQTTSLWTTNAAGKTPYLGNRLAADRAFNGYLQRAAFAIPKGLFDNRTSP